MSRFRSILGCLAGASLRPDAGGGRGRLRAIDGDEKEARRQAILDAADLLFSERQDLANVADVADAAGLAKGTVYLYFQSKEELYLALHLRHVEQFFNRLISRLTSGEPFRFSEMQALADQHILNASTYLPLGACCIGFAAGAVPARAAAEFQARLAEWLHTAGSGLERHFLKLPRGEGVRLLKHSYAIMVGLYSLLRGERGSDPMCPRIEGMGSFKEEASLALQRYWAHVAGIEDTTLTNDENLRGNTEK